MFRQSLLAIALLAPAPLFAQAEPPPLTRAKVTANVAVEFKKIDANNDGQLTKAEIEQAQLNAIRERIQARNRALFAMLDADKSGQISAAEFNKLPAAAPRPDASNLLRFDTSKDGKISSAEHSTATFANFDRMDANKDGTVSVAEMRAAAAKK